MIVRSCENCLFRPTCQHLPFVVTDPVAKARAAACSEYWYGRFSYLDFTSEWRLCTLMKFNLYAIRDCRTGFMAPSTASTDEAAIRDFYFAILNSKDILGHYPSDFDFYRLAVYDAESGQISPCSPPVYLASGSNAFSNGPVKEAE